MCGRGGITAGNRKLRIISKRSVTERIPSVLNLCKAATLLLINDTNALSD